MKQLWRNARKKMNQNIGRKMIFLMVPVFCVALMATTALVNYMYKERFIANIEEGSQYLTDTFKLNMDFCTTDVKSLLNTLSMNESVRTLMTMDRENIDYGQLLWCEREMKRLLGSMISMKSYVQDVLVLGKNGYQYNYLEGLGGKVLEEEWFAQGVDFGRKGFQYVLPHDVDYYKTGKRPASQAISIVLPVRKGGDIVGYVVCDLRMEKAGALPDGIIRSANMRAYLVNDSTKEYYDFQTKENCQGGEEDFIRYVGDKDSDFLRADRDFIVYSKMESSEWYIAAVYLYRDIVASAVEAQKIGFLVMVLGCFLIVIFARMISRSVKKPIDEIIDRIQQVEMQDFNPVEIGETVNQPGELVLIRNHFEEMIHQINELVHKVYLGEIYRKNMEYESLVNQMNPHFMYNVLQLLQAKAVLRENYEIEEIVVALSRMMRYTMGNRERIVTFKEECSYVESYLELYRQRYSHKFTYEIFLEKELEMCPVLKFIIQPIAENCIKHGFKNLKREGRVRVKVCQEGENVCIKVEDNGKGIEEKRLEELKAYIENGEDKAFESIGLRNAYRRVKLTYGEDARFTMTSVEDQSTEISFTIPKSCLFEADSAGKQMPRVNIV